MAARLEDDAEASIATLGEPISDVEMLFNPNVVKVVRDFSGRALYFSRAPIPWDREAWDREPSPAARSCSSMMPGCAISASMPIVPAFLAAYRHWAPHRWSSSSSSSSCAPCSTAIRIQVALASEPHPAGVDTEADLERVRALFADAAMPPAPEGRSRD